MRRRAAPLSSSVVGRQTPAAEHQAELTSRLRRNCLLQYLWTSSDWFYILASLFCPQRLESGMWWRGGTSIPLHQHKLQCASLSLCQLCHQPFLPLPPFTVIMWQTHPVISAKFNIVLLHFLLKQKILQYGNGDTEVQNIGYWLLLVTAV